MIRKSGLKMTLQNLPQSQGKVSPVRVKKMGKIRNVYGVVVGKPEKKRPLARPRR